MVFYTLTQGSEFFFQDTKEKLRPQNVQIKTQKWLIHCSLILKQPKNTISFIYTSLTHNVSIPEEEKKSS